MTETSPSRIAIIGASSNHSKFGNKSVRAHLNQSWTVYPVHPKAEEIEGLKVFESVQALPEAVDRIAFYLPPQLALPVLDEIAQSPSRGAMIFFNPGAGSPELRAKATDLQLDWVDSCAIVAIGESPGSYR